MTDATANDQAAKASEAPEGESGWEWAIVEIFGHRRHAGRIREEERFGAKMLRVDVPTKGDPAANGWKTHYYGGSSIFSFSLTDEATALRLNRPYDAPARLTAPIREDAAQPARPVTSMGEDDDPDDPAAEIDDGDEETRL